MTQELETTTPEEVKPPNLEEMSEQMKSLQDANRQLAETNERILRESKTHADKWRQYRDAASDDETKKLEDEKNWKALMEKERGEKTLLKQSMEQLRRKTLKKTLDFEVARYASDANDVTDIINSLPSDLVQIDEDTMTIEGVSDAVNSLRESKPYLFKTAVTPETVNTKPGFIPNAPAKTLEQFNMDDKINALKDALVESYST